MEQPVEDVADGQQKPKEAKWVKVGASKKAYQVSSDAIVIAGEGKLSYTDMIQKFKTKPELDQPGDVVHKIRRTQKVELLLHTRTEEKRKSAEGQ